MSSLGKYKEGICSGCGKEKLITQKRLNLCSWCNQDRLRKKSLEKTKHRYQSLKKFYKDYWDKHENRECYECGKELLVYRNWHIAHIIPKREQKNYSIDITYNYDNICYLCFDCHSQFDNGNPELAPRVAELLEYKLKQYRNEYRGKSEYRGDDGKTES